MNRSHAGTGSHFSAFRRWAISLCPFSSCPGGMWAEVSAPVQSVLEAQMSYQDAAGSQSLAFCHDGNVQGFGQVARIKQLKPQMRNSNFQSF